MSTEAGVPGGRDGALEVDIEAGEDVDVVDPVTGQVVMGESRWPMTIAVVTLKPATVATP